MVISVNLYLTRGHYISVIPFLNKLIHVLTEKEHLLLMLWSVGVYVILPSFAKANVVFNYITWFSILYILASYIRLYPKIWFSNLKMTGIFLTLSVILSWLSVVVLAMVSRTIGKPITLAYFFVADSNKILVVVVKLFCNICG